MSTVVRKYNTFTYEDESRGIQIIMEELSPPKSRNVEAHVVVWAMNDEEEWFRLFRARNGISTVSAHEAIAKAIEKKLNGDEKSNKVGLKGYFGLNSPVILNDWHSTINDACEEIIAKHKAGKPPMNLYTEDEDDDEVWRIAGLLSEDINVVYGQSGSGKSYLALIWGQAIQHGVPVCGLPSVQGNVMLVDYETTTTKIRKRLKRVDDGLSVSGDPMLYVPATTPIANMTESLQKYIIENNISFLIIDSLARAVGGKITDEEGVGFMFEAIRQLERPCLIIHHTNRADEYYGSPFIRAYARNLWRLRSVQNEGQGKMSLQLAQEKENDGPGMGELGFMLKFNGDPVDPDSVVLEPENASMVPELRKHTRRFWQQIYYHVEETPYHRILIDDPNQPQNFTGSNISNLLGLNSSKQSTLRSYIWALKNDTKKYKKLAEEFHVDGKYLCLNTETGCTAMPFAEQPDEVVALPDSTVSTISEVIW